MSDNTMAVVWKDPATLKIHADNPKERTQNTTDLQASVRAHGVQVPLTLANDGTTILSGARRRTAALAVGCKQVPCIVTDTEADSAAALDVLMIGNDQDPMTHEQKLQVLQAYQRYGISMTKAAHRVGISATEASFLCKLAAAPKEIRDAITNYDEGKGGLSFGAYKKMAHLPGEQQVAMLNQGKTTIGQVTTEVKRQAKTARGRRLVDDPKDVESLITRLEQARQALVDVHAFVSNGATPEAKAMLFEAARPVARAMQQIKQDVTNQTQGGAK